MFTTYIYQPFFNILVGIYWALGQIAPELADMGVAVILFSIVVRLVMLPLSLSGDRTEEEKRVIIAKTKEIKASYSHDPVGEKQAVRSLLKSNRRIVVSTTINLFIQVGIVLMLYRIFTTGLTGQDLHLLYDFMPNVGKINLTFLGRFDLTHPNSTLNFLQSLMIFVVEALSALNSPFPLGKKDVAVMQFFLPVISYVLFMFLPAGKKLFIITSLAFTTVILTYKILRFWTNSLLQRLTPPPVPTEA